MHVECADQVIVGVDHEQRVDAQTLHGFDGLDRKTVGADCARRGVHDRGDVALLQINTLFKGTTQVAVRENAEHHIFGRGDCDETEAAALHGYDRIGNAGCRRDGWYQFTSAHDITNVSQQAPAE